MEQKFLSQLLIILLLMFSCGSALSAISNETEAGVSLPAIDPQLDQAEFLSQALAENKIHLFLEKCVEQKAKKNKALCKLLSKKINSN